MIFNEFRVCFLVASATHTHTHTKKKKKKKKKKRFMFKVKLVGPRNSELTAHYIYDLVTGLVVS